MCRSSERLPPVQNKSTKEQNQKTDNAIKQKLFLSCVPSTGRKNPSRYANQILHLRQHNPHPHPRRCRFHQLQDGRCQHRRRDRPQHIRCKPTLRRRLHPQLPQHPLPIQRRLPPYFLSLSPLQSQ